jgi:hypothetical protein
VTLAVAAAPRPRLKGHANPRIAPPVPARSDLDGFRAVAKAIGIVPMPWQETAARYLEALAPDGRHLYREVAIVVGRQNGKTTELVPVIVKRLKAGRRIMHTAQNRELPREVFGEVADIVTASDDPDLALAVRAGRTLQPRFANGQEEIRLANGGRYRIVAPTRGGARGGTNDDVIIDELRELESFDFIAAAKPTMTTSPDPQILYLSNAGAASSVVLNSVRARRDTDPRLAYLEWSAHPDRALDDRAGWAEGNPAIGHIPSMLEYLEDEFRTNSLAGTLNIFETEHLCRWVGSLREPFLDPALWASCQGEVGPALRPTMGISLDPSGKRASAAIAWALPGGLIGLRLLFDVTGDPIDTDKLGADLRENARRAGVRVVGFDSLTDAVLAKRFTRTEAITGTKHVGVVAGSPVARPRQPPGAVCAADRVLPRHAEPRAR